MGDCIWPQMTYLVLSCSSLSLRRAKWPGAQTPKTRESWSSRLGKPPRPANVLAKGAGTSTWTVLMEDGDNWLLSGSQDQLQWWRLVFPINLSLRSFPWGRRPTRLQRAASPKVTATSQECSSWNSTLPQSNFPTVADPKKLRGKKPLTFKFPSLSLLYMYLLLFVIFQYMYFCAPYFLTKHYKLTNYFTYYRLFLITILMSV